MKNSFALILSLIFFEGFIILCDGKNVSETGESSKVDVSANQSPLPNHLIADIIFRAGFETTLLAANAGALTQEVIEKIFRNHIIEIEPKPLEGWERSEEGEEDKKEKEIIENKKGNERHLKLRNYHKLMRLFELFGENVRKIHIYYVKWYYNPETNYSMDDNLRCQINDKIIKKYKNQLTEFGMYTSRFPTSSNERIWEEISDEKGKIHFPKVKKFVYSGRVSRNPFDVNAIFPKIESFRFTGEVEDINFLKNVRNLKELHLNMRTIREKELSKIIANNKGITKLTIGSTIKLSALTGRSIAENLKNLKILKFRDIRGEFFVPNNNEVYNLTSVTKFIFSGNTEVLYGNLSFDMPNLENLKVIGDKLQDDIAKFINRFRKLKTVYLDDLYDFNTIGCACVKHLIHVKEFVTSRFTTNQLPHLEDFFKNFNEGSSKLNTIKWWMFEESEYLVLEDSMKKINDHLKNSGKPTWQISHGSEEHDDEINHYLMLKRDP